MPIPNANPTLNTNHIGFIGAGNMASAIIAGLIQHGMPGAQIHAANPTPAKLSALAKTYGVCTYEDNIACVNASTVVIVCVKPDVLPRVLQALAPALQAQKPLLISVVAGARLPFIANSMGDAIPCVRCMPNTPARIGLGATALCPNAGVTPAQRQVAQAIFDAVGVTDWVDDEALLDVVTAVTGSGPAYVFYFMQALVEAASARGLPKSLATRFVVQLLQGSSALAAQASDSLEVLREQVTSTGGTTAAGMDALTQADFAGIIDNAVACALARAKALAEIPGGG